MKTLLTNIASAACKNAIRALGAYSLLAMLVSGEVNASRFDSGEFIISQGTWTHIASACMPDEGSLDYKFSGAGVSLPDATTGEIVLRCNVTNILHSDLHWDTLEVVYSDPDGSGTGNQVTATLHKVSLNGSAERKTPVFVGGQLRGLIDQSLLATFDSNAVASATSSTQVHKVALAHDFDFAQNAYYVKITVKRAEGSTTNPAAFIVRLYETQFIGG